MVYIYGSSPRDTNHGDIFNVVFVMGKTGAGKSTFINTLGGKNIENGESPSISHGSHSCTVGWAAFCTKFHGQNVLLIDTPGFDDTNGSDEKTLRAILSCLHFINCTKEQFKLYGVVFLHDISETRYSASQQKTFSICEKLCGTEAIRNVVVGLTKCSTKGTVEFEHQLDREKEIIEEHWQSISCVCHLPSNDSDAAFNILSKLLHNDPTPLLAQIEIANCLSGAEPELDSTTAGDYLLAKQGINTQALERHKVGRRWIKRLGDKVDMSIFISVPGVLVGFPAHALIAVIRLFRRLRK